MNVHETVTGAFTRDGDFHIPVAEMRQAIERVTGGEGDFFDSTELSTRLTGDSIGANIMLLGYACQKGYLPVKRESLEQAIADNGVAVAYNLRAFTLGRLMAHAPEKVEELMEEGFLCAQWSVESEDLEQLVGRRYRDLTDYQDEAYARQYLKFVQEVRSAEAVLGDATAITEAVARNLYKVMAYKDEYEVARLYTDGNWLRSIENQFTGDYSIKFHMAPPLISKRDPETGELQKREFGPWMYRALQVMAKLKFLRGGALDVFGYSGERRAERAFIGQYKAQVRDAVAQLSQDTHATAIEIAALPEQLRGFGHVRQANMETLMERWETLRRELENPSLRGTDVVRIVEPVAA